MSAYAMILACSVFLAAALAFGWSAGGFFFSSKPFERVFDYLVASVSLLLMLALYKIIA
jgi:hypothetical protein